MKGETSKKSKNNKKLKSQTRTILFSKIQAHPYHPISPEASKKVLFMKNYSVRFV